MTFAASVNNNCVGLNNGDVERVVETCCMGCVFSEGSFSGPQDKVKFIQNKLGCRMGVLGRFQHQGEELVDATDENNSEFYVIRGRVCPFFRTPRWSGWQKGDMREAMAQVRRESSLRPDVVIYYDQSMEPSAILDTAWALNDSSGIKPQRLYIANNSEMRPSQMMKLMKDCPLPWRAETMIEDECTLGRSLDVVTKKCENVFVTYFQAGYKPPLNFFDPIDSALYDELDKFICLEPLPGGINGLTVMRLFYRQADGNARSWIWEKAKKISEDQKCQYLVRPVTELVSQLSQ